jgi:hypothetical protein
MEKQERDAHDHPHDKRCEGLCVPWQGEETCFCHSSFCAPTVHATHSHHIDVLTMQTASSPNDTPETHASQPGTTPSETAMQNKPLSNKLPNKCRKRQCQTEKPSLTWRKTCVSIPKESMLPMSNERILFNLSRQATMNHKTTLETAVNNAATSLDNDTHERATQEKKGTDNKTLPSKVNACSNVECPMRPLTHLIAARTQGQKTHLPLKVSMDPGSDHSCVHERTSPKGAAPRTVRPMPAKTFNGVGNCNRIVESQETLLPEFSRSKHTLI